MAASLVYTPLNFHSHGCWLGSSRVGSERCGRFELEQIHGRP